MKRSWSRSAGPLVVSAGGLLVGGIAWLLTVAESTYAGVVRLVQSAQASKAPFVPLSLPAESTEWPGAGMCGVVDGHQLKLGSHTWVGGAGLPSPWARAVLRRMGYEGCSGAPLSRCYKGAPLEWLAAGVWGGETPHFDADNGARGHLAP